MTKHNDLQLSINIPSEFIKISISMNNNDSNLRDLLFKQKIFIEC